MNLFHLISLLLNRANSANSKKFPIFWWVFEWFNVFRFKRDRKSKSYFQDNFFQKLMMESLQQRLREVMTECSVKETFDIWGGMIWSFRSSLFIWPFIFFSSNNVKLCKKHIYILISDWQDKLATNKKSLFVVKFQRKWSTDF